MATARTKLEALVCKVETIVELVEIIEKKLTL